MTGDLPGKPLQLEEALASAGGGGGGIRERPEGWNSADKLTLVIESVGFNVTKVNSYYREQILLQEQVDHWRQTAQDSNANAVLTMAKQRDLEQRHQQVRGGLSKYHEIYKESKKPLRKQQNC